jgi:putative transposase
MNDETREQIALARYKLISPVLAEPGRIQNQYFREQAERAHNLPHRGSCAIAVSTFKAWLRRYRRGSFAALRPSARSDRGRPRKIPEATLETIRARCKAFPHRTIQLLYEELLKDDLLGQPPVCYNTLARLIKKEGLRPKSGRADVRKRFERDEINDLWVCDFMHGPTVMTDQRRSRAILCAIIDDHSRMIVGHSFAAHETISALTIVLKEALFAFGLPKRLYVDNGPAFASELLVGACARTGISLIHSTPYDAPPRGKIERFFRTVRERFLAGLMAEPTLAELNEAFALWLRDDYHHKAHAGIDARPVDRYNASAARVQVRRLAVRELDEIFLARHERIVNNDATISFKGKIYEVPAAYIRQKIEIRLPVDDPDQLYLYDNGARVGQLKLVNPGENATTFRPTKTTAALSFAQEQVEP